MTDTNIFQILGLVYLAIGLGILINPRFYEGMLKRMIEDEAVLFVTGLAVFVIGYFLVTYHNVMQSFGGKELYESAEEKAAHLLYFMVKNHPFTDGNKRSGAYA